MDDEKEQMYIELKQNILKNIGNISAVKLKNKFESQVESKRTLDNIKTVKDLYNILEERDLINEDNLIVLQKILTYLLDYKEINSISEEENHISFYKKQYPTTEKCKNCRKDNMEEINEEHLEFVPHTPTAPSLNNIFNSTSGPEEVKGYEQNTSKLDRAISEVSREVGMNWRHLAVCLKIKESEISNIKKKFQNEDEKAAMEILQIWKSQNRKKKSDDLIKILVENLRNRIIYLDDLADEIEVEYLS
ncbi:uncharacterized protein LOC111622743 isoform X3 [Centruroides sculpturatus]|uniref:uncharacterized protein LOC111622743 isoform X1 n=1 Tax=Centruroides sculpturatus TaxID=218467 RepID=UPI000C6DA27A|nr:uncharacterized protein LOC111622743 isoform X1 [Centruroides sculpturatus]XP_023220927.1 uncharacterized protein LOC111622743 isoform X2 [Centruroides sculpturatus]XP_023220928.1 uncharacterized protein LOC111622743 isoform X3 [Centruroides sculpturatus]